MSKGSIDISSLKVFLEVSQDCNMSAAAKRLDITQPAISSAVHKLEQALEVELFDRASRPLSLTPAGRILQNRGEEIVNSLDNLATEVIGSMHGKMPHLRLGSSNSISCCCVPYFIDRLIPYTSSLSAYTSNTPGICKLMLNKKLDIALATDPLAGHKEINAIALHTEDFLVVAPRWFEGKLSRLSDIAQMARQLPVIRFNDQSLDAIQVERVLRQCNLYAPRTIEADTDQMVLGLVSRDIGWTVMPVLGMWVGKDFLNNVSIHKIGSLHAQRTAYLLYTNAFYASLAEKIVSMVKQTLSEILLPVMKQNYPILARTLTIH